MPGIMQSNLLVPALQAGVVSCSDSLCMTVSHDDRVSFLATHAGVWWQWTGSSHTSSSCEWCTPHCTGGVADCRLAGQSVFH